MISNQINWILCTAFITISLNIFLTQHFYKNLLHYQTSSNLGKYLYTNHITSKDIDSYLLKDGLNSIHYYSQQLLVTNSYTLPTKKFVITNEEGMNDLKSRNYTFKVKQQFPQFNITKLNWKFLYYKTREESIRQIYILEILRN